MFQRSRFSKCNVCTEIKQKLAETKEKILRQKLREARHAHLLKQR